MTPARSSGTTAIGSTSVSGTTNAFSHSTKKGKSEPSSKSPHGICGQVIVGGTFYLLGTDDEETNDFFLTRIDARNGSPKAEDIARVDFQGRALAFDGTRFWSNHREHHEIVAFTVET